ncbi:MAG: hypothetical protein ABF629_10510 [Sporolactobacillus sp.]
MSLNKEELRAAMEQKVTELEAKAEGVRAVLSAIEVAGEQGKAAIAELQASIEEHKGNMFNADLEAAKTCADAVHDLNKKIELQTTFNEMQIQAKKDELLIALENGYAVHKEACRQFKELDKEYLYQMCIATVEADVALLNRLAWRINESKSFFYRAMVSQGHATQGIAMFTFPNIGRVHLGQADLQTKGIDFKSTINKFKYDFSVQ